MPARRGQAQCISRGAKTEAGSGAHGEWRTMNHLTEEQLILHYYGEAGDTLAAEQHLEDCENCRAIYASLQRVLNVVDSLPVPERGPGYGAELWRRLESQLPVRRRFQWIFSPWRWAAAAAFAALLTAAFLAGRYSPRMGQPGTQMASAGSDPQVRERILLVAVGDYLERSQMVLIELANADAKGRAVDISDTQERASDLR